MNTAQQAVAETLRQVQKGLDFDAPDQLLRTVTGEKAVLIPPGCPYSIATNISHAEQWQRSWLQRLKGETPFNVWKDGKDFPIVPAEEWPKVRRAFLDGLEDAAAIAEAEPFVHHVKDNEAAIKKLNQIAVHSAYHLGQVKLLKRILAATRSR